MTPSSTVHSILGLPGLAKSKIDSKAWPNGWLEMSSWIGVCFVTRKFSRARQLTKMLACVVSRRRSTASPTVPSRIMEVGSGLLRRSVISGLMPKPKWRSNAVVAGGGGGRERCKERQSNPERDNDAVLGKPQTRSKSPSRRPKKNKEESVKSAITVIL